MRLKQEDAKEARNPNGTDPKDVVSYSQDSLIVNQTLVFQIKI